MKIVMFAGPGCVGKTSQLEGLINKATEVGKKIAFHKSSTRKSYEDAGISKEDDALKDPEFNKTFQDKVYSDNLTALLAAIDKAKEEDAQVFIADRSPFDYIAYYLTVFQDSLTLKKIEEKRENVRKVMATIYEVSPDTQIVPFLFPVHWSADTISSDGWRADKTGKNFIWGSIIQNEIRLFETGHPSITTTPDKDDLTDFLFKHCFPETNKE